MFGVKENQPESVSGLVLYHYASCPFCRRVRQYVQQSGWRIEEKDVLENSRWREELMHGGGKTQVPCLRVEKQGGEIEWMYESMDIINYLNGRLS